MALMTRRKPTVPGVDTGHDELEQLATFEQVVPFEQLESPLSGPDNVGSDDQPSIAIEDVVVVELGAAPGGVDSSYGPAVDPLPVEAAAGDFAEVTPTALLETAAALIDLSTVSNDAVAVVTDGALGLSSGRGGGDASRLPAGGCTCCAIHP